MKHRFIRKIERKIRIKIVPLIFIGLLLVIGSIGGIYAYFFNSESIVSRFQAAGFHVSIDEEFYNTWGTKKIMIVNDEKIPVVLRVNYSEYWEFDSDSVLSNISNGKEIVHKNWSNDWDDFTYYNGWYYYRYPLEEKESVKILDSVLKNEDVISSSDFSNDYASSTYHLDFKYEALYANVQTIKGVWNLSDDEISGLLQLEGSDAT